jgi:hypothetical protein
MLPCDLIWLCRFQFARKEDPERQALLAKLEETILKVSTRGWMGAWGLSMMFDSRGT